MVLLQSGRVQEPVYPGQTNVNLWPVKFWMWSSVVHTHLLGCVLFNHSPALYQIHFWGCGCINTSDCLPCRMHLYICVRKTCRCWCQAWSGGSTLKCCLPWVHAVLQLSEARGRSTYTIPKVWYLSECRSYSWLSLSMARGQYSVCTCKKSLRICALHVFKCGWL